MLEQLIARIAPAAQRAARTRRERIARDLTDQAPGGVRVQIEDEAVVLSGRGLRRRFAVEPALRWLLEARR